MTLYNQLKTGKIKLTEKNKSSIEKELLGDKDPLNCYFYSLDFLKGPWKEAEEIISTSIYISVAYVVDVKKERWEEMEGAFRKHPNSALAYSLHILRKPWKEAEVYILGSFSTALKYQKRVKKTPWRDLEDQIIVRLPSHKSPSSFSKYYKKVINPYIANLKELGNGDLIISHIQYLERGIRRGCSKDNALIFNYMREKDITKFPEAEPVIFSSSSSAARYIFDFYKEPHYLAPDLFKDIPGYALDYARYIIKGRFELGEVAILADSYRRSMYLDFLKTNKTKNK